jgi:hypothetical protein
MSSTPLSYLAFDHSEDGEGHGTFDAMAAADARHLPALQSEVARVLAWAHSAFGAPAPLEEGGEWDYEVTGVRELASALEVRYAPATAALVLEEGGDAQVRVTLTLTLTGTAGFCEAFRTVFET